MDAYDRCTNLKKLADIVPIYGRGRELFRPSTYTGCSYLILFLRATVLTTSNPTSAGTSRDLLHA